MSRQLPAPDLPGFSYLRDLGSGGFADVYLYQQEHPYRQVAVKVLRDATVSTRARQMFVAEANAMAQLEHPFIVRVYSTGTTADHRPYIVMSYYPNGSLAARVRRELFSVAEALQVGIQIGAAVETAHRARILHRDIKPANILLGPFEEPGLTDFGIAAQMAAAEEEDAGLSVPWSPPEVLYSTGPAGVSSDVYSLSATLWHLLVGRSPFEVPGGNNSVYELMKRVRDLPVPSTGRREVPSSLDRLLKQGMSKQTNLRPSSALELVMSMQAIEQELQLPRTQIMLARDGASAQGRSEPVLAADRTQVQAPQRTEPSQPGTPTGWGRAPEPGDRRSVPPDGETPPEPTAGRAPVPAANVSRYEEVIEPTRLASRVAAPPEHAAPREERPLPWRALLAVVTVLVLMVGIGATLVLNDRGTKAATSATVSEAPPTVQVGGDVLPPGPVTIKGQRDAGAVTFTWTYSAALDDDQYRYRLADGSVRNTRERSVTLTVPGGVEACLEVMVYRNDGSPGSRDWSPKVCVR